VAELGLEAHVVAAETRRTVEDQVGEGEPAAPQLVAIDAQHQLGGVLLDGERATRAGDQR
jgi:hypothetical protein